MSLGTFSKDKDALVKNNFEKTISESGDKPVNDSGFKELVKGIALNNKKAEDKRPVSFSMTNKQLEMLEKKAIENGFKNRSEFLVAIIENL